MNEMSMTGNDTLILNNNVFSAFADNDFCTLEYQGEIAKIKKGKNGNSIIAQDQSGTMGFLTIRVLRGSSDDSFLNNLLQSQIGNFAGFPLMIGQFIKKVGDGQGNITNDTYILGGGTFRTEVNAKSNASGDTEQSVSIYNLQFTQVNRIIQ